MLALEWARVRARARARARAGPQLLAQAPACAPARPPIQPKQALALVQLQAPAPVREAAQPPARARVTPAPQAGKMRARAQEQARACARERARAQMHRLSQGYQARRRRRDASSRALPRARDPLITDQLQGTTCRTPWQFASQTGRRFRALLQQLSCPDDDAFAGTAVVRGHLCGCRYVAGVRECSACAYCLHAPRPSLVIHLLRAQRSTMSMPSSTRSLRSGGRPKRCRIHRWRAFRAFSPRWVYSRCESLPLVGWR